MDDIEKLLADFDSEDADTEATAEVEDNRPNKAIKQLRDAYDRKLKETRKLEKELEELRSYRTQAESERKVATLKDSGLSDKQAKAFLRMYEDVTPEAVAEFRTEVLGQAVEAEAVNPHGHDHGFAPTQGQLEPGSRTYSKEEFEAIMRSNPADGWKLLNSGKVKF